MRALVKRILRACGYEIVQAHRTPTRQTMAEALAHLARLGLHPSVVIDVGTASGTDELLSTFPDSRFLWIEPLQEFEEDLRQLTKRYRGDYVLAACGSTRGEVTIHVHPNLTGSSTLHEAEGDVADGMSRQVRMFALDDLIERYELQGEIVLKVDVQGAELDVIAGAQKLLNNTEVVILEVEFFRFFGSNPDFGEVIAQMKRRGFVTYDVVGGTNRLLDGALAQKDLVFVKEDGRFRQSHHWATPEQRNLYVAKYRGRRTNSI